MFVLFLLSPSALLQHDVEHDDNGDVGVWEYVGVWRISRVSVFSCSGLVTTWAGYRWENQQSRRRTTSWSWFFLLQLLVLTVVGAVVGDSPSLSDSYTAPVAPKTFYSAPSPSSSYGAPSSSSYTAPSYSAPSYQPGSQSVQVKNIFLCFN